MATKIDKKNMIRQGIIDSAEIYSQNLAGKVFLKVKQYQIVLSI